MDAKAGSRFTVIRDTVLLAFGIAGVSYQTVTGQVDYGLLALFAGCLGLPGAFSIRSLFRGSGTTSSSAPSASSVSHMDSGGSSDDR